MSTTLEPLPSDPGLQPSIVPEELEDHGKSGLAAAEEEILESGSAEEEETPPGPCLSPSPWNPPPELARILNLRIEIWCRLIELDRERQNLRKECRQQDVLDEIASQAREFRKPGSVEAIARGLRKNTERQTQVREQIAQSHAEGGAEEDGDPRDLDQAKAEREGLAALLRMLEMGAHQQQLLLARAQLDERIPAAGLQAAEDEPIPALCRRLGLEAGALFGWTFYALAVSERADRCRLLEEEQRQRDISAQELNRQKKPGLVARFKPARADKSDAPSLDSRVPMMREGAGYELQLIEPQLTQMYWTLAEEMAVQLAAGKVDKEGEPHARALLRFGLVAVHPGLIPPASLSAILDQCRNDVRECENSATALNVLYSDEYILAVHKRAMPPSPDEDVEINGRGTDLWRADKTWRRCVALTQRAKLYAALLGTMQGEARQLEEDARAAEEKKARFKDNKSEKSEQKAAAGRLSDLRGKIGRLKAAIERIETKVLPDVQRQVEAEQGRMSAALEALPPEAAVRREVRFIRKIARLCARLKEPFPQFVLREFFSPEKPEFISRSVLIETLRNLEERDVTIFHDTLIPHKKRDQAVSLRLSPVFLIVPGRGSLGLTISPRKPADFGRFATPMIAQRSGGHTDMLIDMLSDFRWDCSKEDAGMDWLMADALCAGYATIRWAYRSKTEKAQKRACIDKKQRDRQNWRIHYRMFINSAHEQGRTLFNKCYDVYQVVIKYIGLPPGVEVLRKD